jgi:hypothetical protein
MIPKSKAKEMFLKNVTRYAHSFTQNKVNNLIDKIYSGFEELDCEPCTGIGNLCEISPYKCQGCKNKDFITKLMG